MEKLVQGILSVLKVILKILARFRNLGNYTKVWWRKTSFYKLEKS
jgi:hypothetical protein